MIPEYADDLDFENRLPVGQAPILTTSVKRFHAYMQFMMQSRAETGYATMDVITGDAGVAKTLIATLNGEQAGHNVYDMEAVAAEAIRRNDLDLILVDEGDWLNVESFEFLRHIFDRTGCPIVIIGLPRTMRVITRHEKFVSRVGLHMEFLPLTQEEVLTTVLPALTLPYWQYPDEPGADRQA